MHVTLANGTIIDSERATARAGAGSVASAACACGGAITAAVVEPFDAPFPAPEYPSSADLERPDWLQPGQGLTITDDGHVAGYFFQNGSCLVHDHTVCPASSPTGYAAFHQQDVVLDDGSTVQVGVIGQVGGHASPWASASAALEHYANPDRQRIICRAGDDEHGGWIAGVLVPGLTYGQIAELRRCALSGDWRPMGPDWWTAHGIGRAAVAACEGYDCIGPTLVTRPGLPLVKRFGRAASAGAVLGGLGGVSFADNEEDTMGRILQPDGTVIEFDDPTEPRVAAPPMPPPQAGPPPAPAKPPAASPDLEGRVATLEEQVAQLGDAVGQMVSMMQGDVTASADAIIAGVLPLDDDPAIRAMLATTEQSTAAEEAARSAGLTVTAATFNTAQRRQLADKGAAMPDGSFPIRNQSDLSNAVQALGRANNPAAVKAHIRKRAGALGLTAWLKEHTSWAAGVAA